MKTVDVQKRLVEFGFDPGPIDGIWGRKTAAALKAFQRWVGIEADAVLGPITMKALFPTAPAATPALKAPELLWFQEATRLLGTRETPGSGSNPEILDWADDLDLHYGNDSIPWCGLFVGHCVASTLPDEPLPAGLLQARAWEKFGKPIQPTPGAVMVFWREKPASGKGHVGFYAGESPDGKSYRILGGNQSDKVSLAWVGANRLVGARWPATVPATATGRVVIANRNEPLSWNEA